jgi:hypothetical protein
MAGAYSMTNQSRAVAATHLAIKDKDLSFSELMWKTARDDPTVYAYLRLQERDGMSDEQTMRLMVVALAKDKAELQKTLIDVYSSMPMPITIKSEP